jgi:Zn-dependent M28 family amino/carboxypeptidase
MNRTYLAMGLATFLALSARADCELSGTVTDADLLSCVSGQSALEHMTELQKIADSNNNTRAAGTVGHELSANYVAQRLLAAGYQVQLVPFDFVKFKKIGAAYFEMQAPDKVTYVEDKDFKVMTYSPSGNISAYMTAVDISLGLENKSTSACEAEDFKDFPKGNIALVQRGTCPFALKAQNAQAAGASGVLIFNQGDQESRRDVYVGTLSAEAGIKIPVLATSYQVGEALSKVDAPTLRVEATTTIQNKVSYNVIAETKTGNADNIVFLGSHLDSVDEGPGINDNGSGSAGILEVALKMKNVKTNNKLRFAWWGAEELGLVGSTKYVESLPASEKSKIALYLNFDMIASPNHILGVYDGDGSKFAPAGPKGSEAIEQLLHMFYSLHGPASMEVPMNGRSDYAPFAAAGIPVGGSFTGAEGTKTEGEAALYGGEKGKAYDSCYHQACDTISNLSMAALETNVDAVAFLALTYGFSTDSVTGQKGFDFSKRSTLMSGPKPVQVRKMLSVPLDCVGEAFLE